MSQLESTPFVGRAYWRENAPTEIPDDVILQPASNYTLAELTSAYNQTRVDYIIPMPMTAQRLQEYIDVYDINLSASCIALDRESGGLLGLAMLGVRNNRSWLTRLGVLPNTRRSGLGKRLMRHVVAESEVRGLEEIWLEVIKGNVPAYQLFCKIGFEQTRELVVYRRPPSPPTEVRLGVDYVQIEHVDDYGALELLGRRSESINWLNQAASFQNVRHLTGFILRLPRGRWGWVVYEPGMIQLRRIMVQVERGDVTEVTAMLLAKLHHACPTQDAVVENLGEEDARLPGYREAGYFETFRRVEMVKKL